MSSESDKFFHDTHFANKKEELVKEYNSYIQDHPELNQLLHDFVTACLVEKPDNVNDFAKSFFLKFADKATQERVLLQQENARLSGESSMARPIVLCGPSGVGKGTLTQALMKIFNGGIAPTVSHTTRQARPGEENGVAYHFVSKENFESDIKQKKFIEYATVHGNYYGTSFGTVHELLRQGKTCILDIDVGRNLAQGFRPESLLRLCRTAIVAGT